VTASLDVIRVLWGHEVPGVGFTVRELRLPRAVLEAVGGLSFGLAGAAFQVVLRNPRASPDIIGISAGVGAAAVFAIVFFEASDGLVSVFAALAALLVAMVIYPLAWRDGALRSKWAMRPQQPLGSQRRAPACLSFCRR